MKLLAVLILLLIIIIESAVSLPMLNTSNASLEQARQTIINEKIQLNQLNDAFNFLSSVLNNKHKNFLVSPFFKNRCGGLYHLIIDEHCKSIISIKLNNLGFYEYHGLFSVTDNSSLSAVDFILTSNSYGEVKLKKTELLKRKGVIIGDGILDKTARNKTNNDVIIAKIVDEFKTKFGKNTLDYVRYFKDDSNENIFFKIISVVNFTGLWEDEFQDSKYQEFTLSCGKVVTAKFMQNIIVGVVACSSYGIACRIFYKNKKYALDIILSHDTSKDSDLSIGYIINLIIKLNTAHGKNQTTKYFIAMPEFEFKQFNNNITDYVQDSLLEGATIDSNINFVNNSDIKRSLILQDINIKVDKKGINTGEITQENFAEDFNNIKILKKYIINKPFFFMLSELCLPDINSVNFTKIIATGKINNPNIVE